MLGRIDTLERVYTPANIVDTLPQGPYQEHYQPTYQHHDALVAGVHELQSTEPVTTPEEVMLLRGQLAAIARGDDSIIVRAGRCHEPVRLETPIAVLAREGLTLVRTIATAGLARVLPILRACGQNTKPRSNEFERQPDGSLEVSFMGEAINGRDPVDRLPEPNRLVGAALQARDVEAMMTGMNGGEHVMVSHEALSLPYEKAFVYVDPVTGRKVLLSADQPWVGERTNKVDDEKENQHLDLLAEVENPVGVKVGPKSDAEHIAKLAQKLNPEHEPGKLTFMIRVGDNVEAMHRILDGIGEFAPESLIEFDIHGSTIQTEDGAKIRAVSTTVEHIRLLAETCAQHGLRLHGLHLEAMGDDSRLECVDTPDQRPTHQGDVDPQFNPRQLRSILTQVLPILRAQTKPPR